MVPNPLNSQSLDRYAYVVNNPIRYTDPTGYRCIEAGECSHTRKHSKNPWDGFDFDDFCNRYGIKFKGNWSDRDKWAVVQAVMAVAIKLASLIGGTASDAFRKVYRTSAKDPLVFQWGCPESECEGGGGYTANRHLIKFATISSNPLQARNNVVHELGHAFDAIMGQKPRLWLYWKQKMDPNFPNRFPLPEGEKIGPYYGFAGRQGDYTWQQNPSGETYEEFADMFLGWVFNTWETGPEGSLTPDGQARSDWMENIMRMLLK